MRPLRILSLLTVAAVVAPLPAPALPVPLPGPKCRATEAGTPAGPSGPVTVATFNALHGLTEEPPAYPTHSTLDQRLAIAADQIAGAGIDVLGMQEVSWIVPNPPGAAVPTQHATEEVAAALADALAAGTGETWYWCWYLANPHFDAEPDLQEGGGGPISDLMAEAASGFVSPQYTSFKEGLAVLSRYPIVAAKGIHLPGRLPIEIPLCFASDDPAGCALTAGFERRAALWARLETPAGPVDITTTHLAHDITDASDASSLQQAAIVLAFMEAQGGDGGAAHRIFVCDCNAQPDDDVPVIGVIKGAGWLNTFEGDCATDAAFCTAGGDVIVTPTVTRVMDERLDYVFWKPGTCASAPTGGRIVIDEPGSLGEALVWPSDHRGVAAELTTCP